MSIMIAGKEPNAIKVGSQDVKAVYAGATLVWPSGLSQSVIDDWNAYAGDNSLGANPYTGDQYLSGPSVQSGYYYAVNQLREWGAMEGSPRNGRSGNSNVRANATYNRIIQHMVESYDEFKWLEEKNVSVMITYRNQSGLNNMLGENFNGYQSADYTAYGTGYNYFTVIWLATDGTAKKRDPEGAVTGVDWATATKAERRLFTGAKRRPKTKPDTQEISDE
jgi:hypothetical protein